MKSRSLRLFLLLTICMMLTGCFRGEFRVSVNKDGSADLNYKVLGVHFMADKINEMKQDASKNNMAVNDIQEGNYKGFQAVNHLEQASEIKDLNIFKNSGKQNETSGMRVEPGWFYDQYILDTKIDFDSEKKPSQEAAEFVQAMLSQVQIKVILDFPVKPEYHNANSMQNEGKTLEWNLMLDKSNSLQAKITVLNWGRIIFTAMIVAALIVFIIYAYWKSQKGNPLTMTQKASFLGLFGAIVVGTAVYYYFTLPKAVEKPVLPPVKQLEQNVKKEVVTLNASNPLEIDDYSLKNVRLGDSLNTVIQKLGNPNNKKQTSEGLLNEYGDLEVTVNQQNTV